MPELKMAVGDRLETKFLLSGRVAIDGFDIEMVNPGPAPAPIFPDMVTTLPYDVGELTIANFVIARDQGVPIIGLPVFPNLFFPLTGVTVNKRAGIAAPADLAGKRVGVPLGFASNPAVWLRGILEHHYSVAADSITWVEGERDSLAGVPYPRPARFKREQRSDLDALLAAGEIDALVVAGGGSELSGDVARLIDDPYPALDAYVAASGAFPINTMLVMKEASVAANPGLPPRWSRHRRRRGPSTTPKSPTTRSTRGCSWGRSATPATSRARTASERMDRRSRRWWDTSTNRASSGRCGRSKTCSCSQRRVLTERKKRQNQHLWHNRSAARRPTRPVEA